MKLASTKYPELTLYAGADLRIDFAEGFADVDDGYADVVRRFIHENPGIGVEEILPRTTPAKHASARRSRKGGA